MKCKWAKGYCFQGKQNACLNPQEHDTRCHKRECPFSPDRGEEYREVTGGNSGGISGWQSARVLSATMLKAAYQCGDLFDVRDD